MADKRTGNSRRRGKWYVTAAGTLRAGEFKRWLREQITSSDSRDKIDPLLRLFEEYLNIVPSSMEETEDEHETPSEESPLITPYTINGYHDLAYGSVEPEKVRNNDELLVKWFGRWSLSQAHRHRRLYIVWNGDESLKEQAERWAGDWQHVSMSRSHSIDVLLTLVGVCCADRRIWEDRACGAASCRLSQQKKSEKAEQHHGGPRLTSLQVRRT